MLIEDIATFEDDSLADGDDQAAGLAAKIIVACGGVASEISLTALCGALALVVALDRNRDENKARAVVRQTLVPAILDMIEAECSLPAHEHFIQ